jgi:hypothetical protein
MAMRGLTFMPLFSQEALNLDGRPGGREMLVLS